MFRFLIFISLVFVLPAGIARAGDNLYIATVDYFVDAPDLPLPPGFAERVDESTVFEVGRGRILDLVALGPGQALNHDKIAAFYAETLPALGWKMLEPGHFQREQDVLNLELQPQNQDLRLHIRVTPGS